MKGILVDLGGVLVDDLWPRAADDWSARLGIEPTDFLAALFGGHEEAVLVGRVDEWTWWREVGRRLGVDGPTLEEIVADMARRERWDHALADHLGGVRDRARIVLVSNAWPGTRERISGSGRHGVLDELVLSCEVGVAKPDCRIFEIALAAAGVPPAGALFIDDVGANVEAARRMGLVAHLYRGRAGTVAAIDRFLAGPGA